MTDRLMVDWKAMRRHSFGKCVNIEGRYCIYTLNSKEHTVYWLSVIDVVMNVNLNEIIQKVSICFPKLKVLGEHLFVNYILFVLI